MDPVSYVKLLELDEYRDGFQGDGRITAEPKQEGFVDAGSLVSFTSEVGGQHKADVLNSTLLAQLAADKKYDRNYNPKDWYEFYIDVMEHIGWVLQSMNFSEYKSDQKGVQLSAVTVELLAALAVGEEMIIVVQETLNGLKKSGNGVTVYNSNSTSGKNGNFQIIPCTVDKSNQVSVGFIGGYFTADKVDSDYFFFTYSSQNIQLYKSAQVFTLNEDVYSQVREQVIKKLGDRAKEYVVNLDI